MRHLLVKGQSGRGRFKVNKGIQNVILVAVRVAMRVHTLGDEIGGQVSHIAIVELDRVNASIEDGIVVCTPDGSTVGSVLPRDNSTTLHFLAEGKKQFGRDIVVSDVRGRWLLVVKVGVMVG